MVDGEVATGTDAHTPTTRRIASAARSHPVATFVLVAYAYSWSYAGLIALPVGPESSILTELPFAWGPLVGGAVALAVLGGDHREWLGQVRRVRVHPAWYLAGIALVVVATDSATLLGIALGAAVGVADVPAIAYLFSLFGTLLLAGSLEEFGWRGFAQVRLQRRYGALAANVLIGLAWASWHLPLFVLMDHAYDPANLGPYYATLVSASVVFGWLYNSTDGALPVVMVAHAASNMPPFLAIAGEEPWLVELLPVSAALYATCAVAVVWYAGADTLTRDGSLPDVPGTPSDRA